MNGHSDWLYCHINRTVIMPIELRAAGASLCASERKYKAKSVFGT